MPDWKLEDLTIAEISPQIESKKISPVELTTLYLDRIARLDPVLNAYVTITKEEALTEAQRAEEEIRHGRYRTRESELNADCFRASPLQYRYNSAARKSFLRTTIPAVKPMQSAPVTSSVRGAPSRLARAPDWASPRLGPPTPSMR